MWIFFLSQEFETRTVSTVVVCGDTICLVAVKRQREVFFLCMTMLIDTQLITKVKTWWRLPGRTERASKIDISSSLSALNLILATFLTYVQPFSFISFFFFAQSLFFFFSFASYANFSSLLIASPPPPLLLALFSSLLLGCVKCLVLVRSNFTLGRDRVGFRRSQVHQLLIWISCVNWWFVSHTHTHNFRQMHSVFD